MSTVDAAQLKTVFELAVGMDQYMYLLRLESVVRQRLNKILRGDKGRLGWEYGETHTTIHVFTSSVLYTRESEKTLAYYIHQYIKVRPHVVSSNAPSDEHMHRTPPSHTHSLPHSLSQSQSLSQGQPLGERRTERGAGAVGRRPSSSSNSNITPAAINNNNDTPSAAIDSRAAEPADPAETPRSHAPPTPHSAAAPSGSTRSTTFIPYVPRVA